MGGQDPTPGSARLRSAAATPFSLPFNAPYETARGTLAHRDLVLLRLTDQEGVTGLGEAVPLTLRGGDRGTIVTELDGWARWAQSVGCLEWSTGRPIEARNSPEGAGDLSPPSRAAVLTALADLEAKRRGVPLWKLLGAQDAAPVRCNATLAAGPPERVAADADQWSRAGFSTYKLKVGLDPEPIRAGDPDRDLAQLAAVREAVGTKAAIRLDANGAWTLERAEQAIEAAAEYGIELVEQPVSTLGEMARLRTLLDGEVPLAADESVTSPESARLAADLGACDLVTVKLSKIGRLDPVLDRRLGTYMSSALDGPVGIAAAAHCHQLLRKQMPEAAGLAQGLATQLLFGTTVAERACRLVGDLLHLPDGPGLGVELNPDALARHATRSSEA